MSLSLSPPRRTGRSKCLPLRPLCVSWTLCAIVVFYVISRPLSPCDWAVSINDSESRQITPPFQMLIQCVGWLSKHDRPRLLSKLVPQCNRLRSPARREFEPGHPSTPVVTLVYYRTSTTTVVLGKKGHCSCLREFCRNVAICQIETSSSWPRV